MSPVELLIAECRENRLPFLDLGNCGLQEIPDDVFTLDWLRELNLSNEWWDWKPTRRRRIRYVSGNHSGLNSIAGIPARIGNLRKLRRLWLNGDTQLVFQLSDIHALASLENLTVLGLSATKVDSLSALSKLRKLQYLDLWNAECIFDIEPLTSLSELRLLDLWGTGVDDLTPLAGLPHLQFVNIGSTQVTDLFPILPVLERGAEIVVDLPEEEVSGVFIEDCDIDRPPPEIVDAGTESVRVFFNESKTQGEDRLYEAKVLLVGEGGAGKTSLIRRTYFPNEPLPGEGDTTKGIEIYVQHFPLPSGPNFRINVWDFGGQEIYHATHQFFLTKRSLYILLDDTRRDHKTVHDEGFKYWLEVVDALSNHSPILIFQNEKGGRSKVIDERGIRERFGNVLDFFRGDLIAPGSADGIRQAIEYHVQRLPHVGESLPAKWVSIRADIEVESVSCPFISVERYFQIYAKHLPFDRERALKLSRYLHDLGVFLHFQDDALLRRTVILQNQWATEAVFRMVDSNSVKANFGRFNSNNCASVWGDSIYVDMHHELLALMQKFELCYPLPDLRPQTWLAPQLLSPSQPKVLEGWERAGDLEVRYRYDFMPKGIVNRLMVRQHRFVKKPELGWVSGVLFESNGTEVLVAVSPTGQDIALRGRGVERRELLAVIAADLEAINESFYGVAAKIQKLIPCICPRCRSSATPEFFNYARLVQRKKDNKLSVECPSSYAHVSVQELLDGIRANISADASRMISGTSHGQPVQQRSKRIISIFLASSSSLVEDRDAFDLYFRQHNDELLEDDLYVKVERWERMSGAVSKTRKQDDYNRRIAECDMFVCLISTRAGDYTREEFETAFESFRKAGKPTIYTYFKDELASFAKIDESHLASVRDFQSELSTLGHFWTTYSNLDQLKLSFRDQLELWTREREAQETRA